MARFDGKSTKQVATTLKLSELSGVTTPAHTGADVTLFKSANPVTAFQELAKASFGEVLNEQKDEQHTRDVLKPLLDKVYTADSALYNANCDAMQDGDIEQVKRNIREYAMHLLQQESATMTPEQEKELSLAKARADMNDVQKAYFDGLTVEAEKDAFLKMSSDAMTATVEMVKGADESHVTANGETLVKSALGDQAFKMLKAQDEQLVKMQNQIDTEAFVKVASDENHKHLPGTAIAKASMLKSIADLPNDVQTTLNECLKAGNAELAKAFEAKAHGTSTIKTAEDKITSLAKVYQEANAGVTFEKAYAHVMSTSEGQKLYEEMGAK